MTKTTNKETAVVDTTAAGNLKNFKTSNEVENFYRFISDNRLRAEAKTLVAMVLKKITPPKRRGRRKNLQ